MVGELRDLLPMIRNKRSLLGCIEDTAAAAALAITSGLASYSECLHIKRKTGIIWIIPLLL